MTLVVSIVYTVIHAYLQKEKMKLKISADKVNYDPKTNEYTVDLNLHKLGSMYTIPIYCYNVDWGDFYSVLSTLRKTFRIEFSEWK